MAEERGQYCVIFPSVEIGTGTRLGNFVLIRSNARIGMHCTIGSNVDI
jgi:UDP-3-O-[3-hydroxymyristoyl] glucosamine N-acyltransferase